MHHLFFCEAQNPCDFTRLILQRFNSDGLNGTFTVIDVEKFQKFIPSCITQVPCIYTKEKDILTNMEISKFLSSISITNANSSQAPLLQEKTKTKTQQLHDDMDKRNHGNGNGNGVASKSELPQELKPIFTQQKESLNKNSNSSSSSHDPVTIPFNQNELGSHISDMYSYINGEEQESTLMHNFSLISNNVRIETITDDITTNRVVDKSNVIENLIEKRNMEMKNLS